MSKSETTLVAWLQERFGANTQRVPIGIGDDMAAVRLDGSLVAVTADMLLDGVHFDTTQHRYEQIGHKAVACSLSDCAAMACEPRVATVSLALSSSMTMEDVQRLYEGMAQITDPFDCAIVGGDITSWTGKLAIDVAMLAEPMALRGPVRRSDARVGDTLYVSGPLGGSILGKHLDFTPRIELARRLADESDLHAMMDISDGLSIDLYRLCFASGCDAELQLDALERVISDAARTLSQQDGRSPLDHALNDGEDFELLVVGGIVLTDAKLSLTPIGQMTPRASTETTTIMACGPTGKRDPIEPQGYEHFT